MLKEIEKSRKFKHVEITGYFPNFSKGRMHVFTCENNNGKLYVSRIQGLSKEVKPIRADLALINLPASLHVKYGNVGIAVDKYIYNEANFNPIFKKRALALIELYNIMYFKKGVPLTSNISDGYSENDVSRSRLHERFALIEEVGKRWTKAAYSKHNTFLNRYNKGVSNTLYKEYKDKGVRLESKYAIDSDDPFSSLARDIDSIVEKTYDHSRVKDDNLSDYLDDTIVDVIRTAGLNKNSTMEDIGRAFAAYMGEDISDETVNLVLEEVFSAIYDDDVIDVDTEAL
jgi:hypothetical protein